MNRHVQPGFTSQKSTKFFWRSSHESALSLHSHARPSPTLSDRNWLAQKLRYFSPALETIRMSVLLRWTTLLGLFAFSCSSPSFHANRITGPLESGLPDTQKIRARRNAGQTA